VTKPPAKKPSARKVTTKTGTGHGRGHGRAPGKPGRPGKPGKPGRPGSGRAHHPGPAGEERGLASRPLRHDLVDAAVLEVHGLVHDQGWLADRALERALRSDRLFASERRAAAEAVYGLTRWQGQLDWLLSGGGGPPPDLVTRYAAWLARFGGVPRLDAARRLGVAAARLLPLEGADERLARLTDPVERLARHGSLPRWLAARFRDELGEVEAAALVAVLNERAPLTVRANLLVGTREALAVRLDAEGTHAEPTRFSPWGLTLDGHQNAFALPSFQAGAFEIQDEGSQLIALCCGARPGMTVVDACAGAGGKALALAMEMRNKGTLWALDSDAGRLEEARRRARRAHVDNLRTRAIAADEAAGAGLVDLAGKADVVLVDAPCSGLGTLRRKPDARWRLAPGDPERFAAIQRTLLGRFAALLKPGGRLVYATCAISRVENEEVAAHAAAALPLEPLPLAPLLGAGRAEALGAGASALQLLPHRHGTDGFFMAAFKKV
jgi:16S rRNA (cytosine967-C5)-methyltransferase